MRQQQGQYEVDPVLEQPARVKVSLAAIEPKRAASAAFDQAFDGTVQELEVNGLRTTPAAPDPSEQRREEKHGNDDAREQEHQQQRVGRQEGGAEQRKLAPGGVKQNRGLAVDLEMRQRDERNHQQVRHDAPPVPPASRRGLGAEPVAAPVLVEGREDSSDRRGGVRAHLGTSTPCGALACLGVVPCSAQTYAVT